MIKAENICYNIGGKKILSNVSATFLPGEFSMILGPNGSGKSTFLKIFSGQLKAGEGNIYYDDKKLTALKKEQVAKVRAVMTQQPELNFPLSVQEVVMMGRYPHFTFNPAKKDAAICDEAMEKMQLQQFASRNYLSLSGGEKQRVQFARVLAQIWEQPAGGSRYLFLDEPLTNLDINYQQEFLVVAAELARSNTVLIAVMHDINLAVQYADKLLFLKEGRVIASGASESVLSESLVKEVFNVDVQFITNPVSGLPLMVYR